MNSQLDFQVLTTIYLQLYLINQINQFLTKFLHQKYFPKNKLSQNDSFLTFFINACSFKVNFVADANVWLIFKLISIYQNLPLLIKNTTREEFISEELKYVGLYKRISLRLPE